MVNDFEQQLREAIALIENKDPARAYLLLRDITNKYPHQTTGWLWLATVAPTQDIRIQALQTVLAIDPTNQQARGALLKLGITPTPQPAPPPPPAPQVYPETFAPPPVAPRPFVPQPIARPSGSPLNNDILFWGAVVVIVLIFVGIIVVILVSQDSDSETAQVDTATPTATITPIPPTPTITNTPRPTQTTNPLFLTIPTLPPSWTPVPTLTTQPSQVYVSWTPLPTRTLRPTFTPTFTPTITPTPPSFLG